MISSICRIGAIAVGAACVVFVASLLGYRPLQVLSNALFLALFLAPFLPILVGIVPGTWLRRDDPPPHARCDLERRRPVWSVLSEFYLDTELDSSDHARIASVVGKSGYTAGQLEEILYRELHPVLHGNLLHIAGEWACFDERWLEQRILDRRPFRWGFALVPDKWLVREQWCAVQSRLEVSRTPDMGTPYR